MEAKDYQDDDALAVEATGYALLTMFMVEGGGVTIIQDQIVQWLNTMRLGDGGFISTVDTVTHCLTLARKIPKGMRHGPFTIWSSASQFCLFQGRRSGLDG